MTPPSLLPSPPLGRSHGRFREEACWDVLADGGEPVGQVWKGVRDDGAVCWMQHPLSIGFSIPCFAVVAGYSRTTRKEAAASVLRWHELAGRTLDVDGWKVHLSDERRPRSTWLAITADGRTRWVHLSHNESEAPHLGAMGTPGWHATSRRGARTVCVHDAATPEEALSIALAAAGTEPDAEEAKARFMLSAERHRGSLFQASPLP